MTRLLLILIILAAGCGQSDVIIHMHQDDGEYIKHRKDLDVDWVDNAVVTGRSESHDRWFVSLERTYSDGSFWHKSQQTTQEQFNSVKVGDRWDVSRQ